MAFSGSVAPITGAAVGIGRAAALLPSMVARGFGRVINVASVAGYISGQNIQIDGCRKRL